MGTGKAQSRYRERDLSLVRSIPDVAIAATNHFLNRSKTNSRESACSKAASEFVGTFPVDDNPVSQDLARRKLQETSRGLGLRRAHRFIGDG